jgi:hypothetical protein
MLGAPCERFLMALREPAVTRGVDRWIDLDGPQAVYVRYPLQSDHDSRRPARQLWTGTGLMQCSKQVL